MGMGLYAFMEEWLDKNGANLRSLPLEAAPAEEVQTVCAMHKGVDMNEIALALIFCSAVGLLFALWAFEK